MLALCALALTASGCGSPRAPPAPVTVTPVEAMPAGAQASHGRAGRGKRGRAIGRPACAPVRCHAAARCHPVRRWRRSPSAGGSSSASTRTRTCSVSGIPPRASWRVSTSTSPARSRARIFGDPDRIDLRVVEASQREIGVAVGRGRPGGPDLLDHLRPQAERRLLHARTSTPTRRSSPSRDRESILPQNFRASGCAR